MPAPPSRLPHQTTAPGSCTRNARECLVQLHMRTKILIFSLLAARCYRACSRWACGATEPPATRRRRHRAPGALLVFHQLGSLRAGAGSHVGVLYIARDFIAHRSWAFSLGAAVRVMARGRVWRRRLGRCSVNRFLTSIVPRGCAQDIEAFRRPTPLRCSPCFAAG